ncbi:MAG: tetratricopeptide repeat protein [Desulfohalobiaceae bacterium]|nr:tetratricopeptide repeat protein [Desulfohalobiaceae bacterium]
MDIDKAASPKQRAPGVSQDGGLVQAPVPFGPGKMGSRPEEALSESDKEKNQQCLEIIRLFEEGEYKEVVDFADEQNVSGGECFRKIKKQIEISRTKLEKADSYVFKANFQKKDGKLLQARKSLNKALEIYPKYYWAQNLLQKVRKDIQSEITSLREMAADLEAAGKPEEALAIIQEARNLAPEDKSLQKEATRLREAVIRAKQKEVLRKYLQQQAPALDTACSEEARKIPRQYPEAHSSGSDEEGPSARFGDRRLALVRQGLAKARQSEQDEDLVAATGHTFCLLLLGLSLHEEPVREEIVEFARILGMKQFSTGNFSVARDLWQGALRLDPRNSRLRRYLEEVNSGLDNLKKIKQDGESFLP